MNLNNSHQKKVIKNKGLSWAFIRAMLAILAPKDSDSSPLSRKYMKTKRKGERGQCYYSHMDKFFDGNAKRYDQRLQEEFEAMSAAEQAEKDQTF